MKQANYFLEVAILNDEPTIVIRSERGVIVKITTKPEEVASFLEEAIVTLKNFSNNIKSISHE